MGTSTKAISARIDIYIAELLEEVSKDTQIPKNRLINRAILDYCWRLIRKKTEEGAS